jgi:hypothetical protein
VASNIIANASAILQQKMRADSREFFTVPHVFLLESGKFREFWGMEF